MDQVVGPMIEVQEGAQEAPTLPQSGSGWAASEVHIQVLLLESLLEEPVMHIQVLLPELESTHIHVLLLEQVALQGSVLLVAREGDEATAALATMPD